MNTAYIAIAVITSVFILYVMDKLHRVHGVGNRRVPSSVMNSLIMFFVASCNVLLLYVTLPRGQGAWQQFHVQILLRSWHVGVWFGVVFFAYAMLKMFSYKSVGISRGLVVDGRAFGQNEIRRPLRNIEPRERDGELDRTHH